MVPGVWMEGTALAHSSLQNSEIQQRIRVALEEPDATFLVEGHPAMLPDTGFIDLVSIPQPPHCVSLFFLDSYSRLRGSPFVGSVQPFPRFPHAAVGGQNRVSGESCSR
jgi:hypothetical protein